MDVLRLHVLLLNEDPRLLESMKDCLVDQGFEVSMATTKEEADQLIEHNSYHVLVTDLTMPDNDGVCLMKEYGDRFPIVMLKKGEDKRIVANLDQFSCCLLDKSEIQSRLPQAAWKAYQRFKIDCQITKESVAA